VQGSALVVGAGIGGLTVARGLLLAGWTVEVRERERRPPVGGTALGMWPEAMRALDRLDAGSLVRARAVEQRGARILRPDGSLLVQLGADRRAHLVSRGDLLDALGADLPDGTVRWGCPVRGPVNRPDVDVVVAADGIHSTVRGAHWAVRPRPLGTVAFRGTIPGRTASVTETWGRGRLFGITPNGDHATNWFASVREPMLWSLDPYAGHTQVLRALYRGWHPAVAAVLDALDGEVDRRRLFDLPALPSYVTGRVVLVGDAAHAMAPNLGRGACEALVDSVALVDALAAAPDVATALARYDAVRRPPTRRVLRLARLVNHISTATRTAPIRDTALALLDRPRRADDQVPGSRRAG
jgi:2-polyprenyl-6-methoxyphenol hydroxylase-like FAD-dependent oxidoreductase